MARGIAFDPVNLRFYAERIVCDAHPGYVSSRASEMRLPTETVLHHHAHAAASFPPSMVGRWTAAAGEVIALTADVSWHGENGALCGAERMFVVNYRMRTFRRFTRRGALPLEAIWLAKQPWRGLLAQCLRLCRTGWITRTAGLQQQNPSVLRARH